MKKNYRANCDTSYYVDMKISGFCSNCLHLKSLGIGMNILT